MISFLRGILVNKLSQSPRGAYFLLDVNGVGYEVASSSRSVQSAAATGETALLHTSLIVREDAMSLVGFNSREERDLFNILHSAQGVGPKAALSILSALSVSEVAQAVMSGQFKVLTVAKGIGPKLAQKITVDLKEKMTQWRKAEGQDVFNGGLDGEDTLGLAQKSKAVQQAYYEAENVLLSLGYSQEEIFRSFKTLEGLAGQDVSPTTPNPLEDPEHLLREALRWLATASAS